MRTKTALAAPLAATLLALAAPLACASAPATPAGAAKAAAGPVIGLAEVDANVGKSVTVRFTVTGVGFSKDNIFINSQRERGGFICFVPGKAHDEYVKAFGADLKSALVGKTVECTGDLALYKDAPQIVLAVPSQLRIVQ